IGVEELAGEETEYLCRADRVASGHGLPVPLKGDVESLPRLSIAAEVGLAKHNRDAGDRHEPRYVSGTSGSRRRQRYSRARAEIDVGGTEVMRPGPTLRGCNVRRGIVGLAGEDVLV